MSSVSRIIRRLDVYARVDDDLQVKTDTGAAVTIGFWALMAVLVIGEIQAYLMVQPATERVVVDNAIGQRLRINADIVSTRKSGIAIVRVIGCAKQHQTASKLRKRTCSSHTRRVT